MWQRLPWVRSCCPACAKPLRVVAANVTPQGQSGSGSGERANLIGMGHFASLRTAESAAAVVAAATSSISEVAPLIISRSIAGLQSYINPADYSTAENRAAYIQDFHKDVGAWMSRHHENVLDVFGSESSCECANPVVT